MDPFTKEGTLLWTFRGRSEVYTLSVVQPVFRKNNGVYVLVKLQLTPDGEVSRFVRKQDSDFIKNGETKYFKTISRWSESIRCEIGFDFYGDDPPPLEDAD